VKLKEDLNKLEVTIICDKPEEFIWVHDVAEALERLSSGNLLISDDEIGPKFREQFGEAIKKML